MNINRREFNYALLISAGSVALRRFPAQTTMRVNSKRIMEHILALAEFGKNPQGGASRVAYSDADKQGREYVLGLLRDAKLAVRIDAAGNLIGRRAGNANNLKPLLIGSHIDTVPEGGNYDGVVGSIGAIEVAQTLAENNVTTRHPLEVVIFQNEEGGLIGSRAMDGELTEKELGLVSRSGKTIREGIKFIGGDVAKLAEMRRQKGDIAAYLELHIEQGGILDSEKINIGVVEGIVGINWWDVTIDGFANHAGTTAMNNRQDALLACGKVYRSCESRRDERARQTSRHSWQDQRTSRRAERNSRQGGFESRATRSRCREDQYGLRERFRPKHKRSPVTVKRSSTSRRSTSTYRHPRIHKSAHRYPM
jgi:N-carbamoyl-L-amino-acid hydrolase